MSDKLCDSSENYFEKALQNKWSREKLHLTSVDVLFITSFMETKLFPCSVKLDDEVIVLRLADLAAMLCLRGLGKEWLQSPKQRRLKSLKYLPVPLCLKGAQKQGSVSSV